MAHDSRQREWSQWLSWLRFIPLKLHLVCPFIGYVIGDRIGGEVCVTVGLVLGVAIGIPLQLTKIQQYKTIARKPSLIQPMKQGLNSDLRANVLQVVAGLVGAAVGACVGYRIPEEAQALAALGGGVLGFIIGVFAFGAWLMISHFVSEVWRVKPWLGALKSRQISESTQTAWRPNADDF